MVFATIVWLELRASLRRWRFYATLGLLVAVMAVATHLAAASYPPPSLDGYVGATRTLMEQHWAGLNPQREAARDKAVFAVFVHLQGLAVLLIAPLYAASAIAGERERHTLEALLLSDLRDGEIVLGRSLVRLLLLAMLLLAGLPVLFAGGFAIGRPGGVSAGTFAVAAVFVAALSLFALGLGVLASTLARGVGAAAFIAFAGVALFEIALPAIGVVLRTHPSAWVARGSERALRFRPGVLAIPASGVLDRVLTQGTAGPGAPDASPGGCVALLVASGVGALALATVLLRRVGQRTPRPRRRERRRHRTRHVWADPVAWRELRTVASHRRMAGVRMAALVVAALFSALCLATWMSDMLGGESPREADVPHFQGAVVVTACLAWALVALQGGVSIGYEVRNRTLDSLLIAPLSGRSIVRGKLAGAILSASFAMAFPLAFAVVAAAMGATSPRAALLTAVVILAASVLFAAVGLAASLRFPTGPTGAGLSVAIVVALCVGVPAAAEQGSGDRRWSLALASPATAAFRAISDESVWPPHPQPDASLVDENVPPWSRTARDATAWLIAEVLATAGLATWCRRTIECDYRTRQRPQ